MIPDKTFNPFYPWTRALLDAMLQAGYKWFVRQTFPRGQANAGPEVKRCFIISHYNDRPSAEAHQQVIRPFDGNVRLYDIDIPGDRADLFKSTEPFRQYRLFSNTAIPDWKDRLRRFEPMYKSYIEQVLGWRPTGKETVYINIFSQFGELYLTLRYHAHKAKLKLSEIENHTICATTSAFRLQSNWSQNISLNWIPRMQGN